ncbi:DUF6082 family protein [Streptodolium elevatio]|uniref:DUF6082 family protein n=1 Tax=Streptodolium elevatio TaxID=3157996 RepID=A0ABV3DR39_9ACTN
MGASAAVGANDANKPRSRSGVIWGGKSAGSSRPSTAGSATLTADDLSWFAPGVRHHAGVLARSGALGVVATLAVALGLAFFAGTTIQRFSGAVAWTTSGALLALTALVVTAWTQQRELRIQRKHARRTADAAVQANHLELLKLSLADPELAAVWPSFAGNPPKAQERRYLYANMIITHVSYAYLSGEASEEEIRAELNYLFRSPVLSDFWDLSRPFRLTTPPDAPHQPFYEIADEEWQRARAMSDEHRPVPEEPRSRALEEYRRRAAAKLPRPLPDAPV